MAQRFRARITMFAHSQGASHASLMIAHEPSLAAVVLSGQGGDLTQSLLNKRRPIDIATVVPFALLDADANGQLTAGDFHPVLALFQMYFERVDSVNYGPLLHVRPPMDGTGPHVFMTYGLGDTYSPEATMQAYASWLATVVQGAADVSQAVTAIDAYPDSVAVSQAAATVQTWRTAMLSACLP